MNRKSSTGSGPHSILPPLVPYTGVGPKLAPGAPRVKPAPKVNKLKVTPTSSLVLRMEYPEFRARHLSEILIRGNPRVPPTPFPDCDFRNLP